MMEVLEHQGPTLSACDTTSLRSASIRLAPPIWEMPEVTGHIRTKPLPESGPVVSRPTSPAVNDALDPFCSSPVIAAPRFDRFQVAFPSSQSISSQETESGESVARLHEASSRSPAVKPGRALAAELQNSSELDFPAKNVVNSVSTATELNDRRESPPPEMEEFGSRGSAPETPLIGFPLPRFDKSSLPRVLRPRLAINFAWEDMSVPSAITIASTDAKPARLPQHEDRRSVPRATTPPRTAVSHRDRTTSLGWATGLALETASGLARYGLRFVPTPLRPNRLSQRRTMSEHESSRD